MSSIKTNGTCTPAPAPSAGNHPDYAALRPLDLSALKTSDLDSRPSKVFHDDLGRPVGPDFHDPSANG